MPFRDKMDIRQLRYFQAIAEELSYSRAAERLRIAQPALSRAVQELEGDLGAMLFERNRRSVKLTPAGKVLLREVGILFERWEESMRRGRRTAGGGGRGIGPWHTWAPTPPFL